MISIIVPIGNRVEYLEEALESVVDQTYTDWELILIPNGEICEQVDQIMAKFTAQVIRLPKSCGYPAKPRNVGIAYASGDYITWLDSDDMMLPHKLEFLLYHIGDNDLVYGDIIIDGQHVSCRAPRDIQEAMRHNWMYSGAVLAKADVFKQNPLREMAYCEDYELWLRLLVRGYKLHYAPGTPVYQYRLWKDNLSKKFQDDRGVDDEKWLNLAREYAVSQCAGITEPSNS